MACVKGSIYNTAGKRSPQVIPLGGRVVSFPGLESSGPVSDHPLLTILFLREYASDSPRIDAEVGVQDEGLTMELGVSQDGGGHQLLLHDPEGFDRSGVLVEVRDPLVLILFGVLHQRCRNGGVIRQ